MKETILIAILLLILILIVAYFVLYNNTTESFTVEEELSHNNDEIHEAIHEESKEPTTTTTTTYYEYPETYMENNDAVDIDVLYKDYSGPLKNKTQWTDMTLAQCQDACNSMSGCIGFSRNNIDANTEGVCKPRSKLSQCHSIRKGNPSQRSFSSGYTSYIKSNVSDQMTKCIGTDMTLNRMIYIKSVARPFHYVTVEDNSVSLKEFKSTGVEFAEKCKFYIIHGLENSNTISFKMTDINDITYYLVCDTNLNQLSILPIDVSNSTLVQRKSASFELYDGLSNEYMVSIRNPSMDGKKAMYLSISDMSQNQPRINLITLEEANTNEKTQKMATFDILDYISGTSILSTTSKNKSETFSVPTLSPDSLSNASEVLRRTSSNVTYDKPDLLIDSARQQTNSIITANNIIDENELLNQSEQELKVWQDTLTTYNKKVLDEKNNLNKRVKNISSAANKVKLRDSTRDIFFKKTIKNELS